MIAQELELTLQKIFVDANKARHEFVTTEHLLLALMDNDSAKLVLSACANDSEKLRQVLIHFIDEHTPKLADTEGLETQPTMGFQRVMQRAMLHVQTTGKSKEVRGEHVLVAIFGEKDSHAVYFMHQQGMTRLDAINYITHGSIKPKEDSIVDKVDKIDHESSSKEHEESRSGAKTKKIDKNNPLALFTQNLNDLAINGKIDPLIGRDAEVERVIQILCRRRKNNPLLVGEAGVGKTAIAEGLSWKIINHQVPDLLAEYQVFSLDMGALLAGTKYRGDFEARLKAVLDAVLEHSKALLFIDEIHTIIGAGSTSGGTLDASNLLKPILSNGQLKCIGATTFNEYRGIFEKDHALARRFQKVEVVEPSIDQTIQILQGLKTRFEDHHGIKYNAAAIISAAQLSAKYITDRYLPDKAIDVIDEAGAAQRIAPKSKQKKVIGKLEIEAVVAKIARIPPASVNTDDRNKLATLERDLKNIVFGQDTAIQALASSIKMARSGLGKDNKPIGAFLFSGPTGVGKTEVAKQLAYILGIELLRFDMSEYMERHTVSRLIGAPPGYVGFDQGGLLTEAVNKKPHCVLLLDEIEKAHPDVFNILLQVLDNGTLTDNNGRKIDFRNVILVMTTNAGAEALQRSVIGFTNSRESGDEMGEIKRLFSPEFRNRLDAIISFKALTHTIILLVVDKFLMELEEQLHAKKVEVIFTDSLRSFLAKKGFDPLMGARPMQRLIQDTIRKVLADELLFGKLMHGGKVIVDVDLTEKIQLTVSAANNTKQSKLTDHLNNEIDASDALITH